MIHLDDLLVELVDLAIFMVVFYNTSKTTISIGWIWHESFCFIKSWNDPDWISLYQSYNAVNV